MRVVVSSVVPWTLSARLRAGDTPRGTRTGLVSGLAVVGAGFGIVVLAATASGRHVDSTSTWFSAAVGGLYLAAGVVAHLRQPGNRVGLLMVLVAVGWFAEDLQLANDPRVHTVGLLTRSASSGFLVHLVLAFPDGRLRTRVDRAIVVVGYAAVFLFVPAAALFHRSNVPNLLLVRPVPVLDLMIDAVQVALAAVIVVILVARWVAASRPARRVAAPVAVAGLLGASMSVLDPLLSPHGRWLHVVLSTLLHVSMLLLPLAFLLGIWRGRPAVADLLIRMPRTSPDRLRDVLAWALGDPSLEVGFVRDGHDGYVDQQGRPLPVPPGLAVTPVERDGRRVAALLHDPALRDDRDLLRAVASAVALELDNQRLAAEVRAQLAEVRRSRARIVAAGDEQRRKVERDLHDGAQQQLVTVALLLRMARERLGDDADPELTALLARGASGLDDALGELRELARGIHPAVLTDAGLLAAVRALAGRCPLPVHIDGDDLPPLPPSVATTAYFVVAEAVTNALRHAQATRVSVGIRLDACALRVSVSDDGVGGANLSGGTGLTGLRDRVSTLDGDVKIHSGPNSGTTVHATIPVEAAP